jgi:hypothetical protein
MNAELDADGELRYSLRFSGHPQYMQRRLIGEMEQTFTTVLARLPASPHSGR